MFADNVWGLGVVCAKSMRLRIERQVLIKWRGGDSAI